MGRRAISFLERRSNFVEAEFLAKRGAKKQIEYLNTASGGEFAFSVAIEREEVRVGDQDKPAPRALRVTQIFRKENGEWKLLHRHADPLVEKKAPSAVSEK